MSCSSLRVSVIGAGNGGQAMAAFCSSLGIPVCLYDRNLDGIASIYKNHKIILTGAIEITTYVEEVTNDIQKAVEFGDLILVVTTASAHREIAEQILPFLKNGQCVVLNPGRTCGVLEVNSVFTKRPELQVYLGEAQTLVYACRKLSPGIVNIIGVKQNVMLSGRNSFETEYIINMMRPIYNCFVPAKNLIHTGLENIGAIFHPAVVLFNAATIERNIPFYFYRDMTPNVASFIQKLDNERLKIGKSYGLKLMPVDDWIVYAYPGTEGISLCDRMINNPAYHDILAPGSIYARQLTEDIPTGLLPMRELAKIAQVETPIMDAIIVLSSFLLNIDFEKDGRTLKNLQLSHLNKQGIIKLLS